MNDIDAIDRWFQPDAVVRPRSRKNATGRLWRGISQPAARPAHGAALAAVQRATRHSPEVMLKITGGGKGMKEIKRHLDYISRHGEVDLENQHGEQIGGREGINDLSAEWKAGGIPETGRTREAFNLVLSMPAGTSRDAVLVAARHFAAQEFSDHPYVLAEHRDEDHPHVHIAVVARGRDGHRLNPRKQDLFRWRIEFAAKLREQGIDANATRRSQRLQMRKPESLALRQMRAEHQGRFKHGRVPRQRPCPRADLKRAGTLADQLSNGCRPPSKLSEAAQHCRARTLHACRVLATQLQQSGAASDLVQLAVWLKTRLADTKTQEQMDYDRAVDGLTHARRRGLQIR